MVEHAETRRGGQGSGWAKVAWVTAALMLLVPLVAGQLTEEVSWGPGDFLLAGALLFATCGAFELAVRKTDSRAYQAGVGLAVAAGCLLVFVNLAVGIIAGEENPANLLFVGVLAVGVIGAVLARFRPAGMARAMLATALAQGAVAGAALTLGSAEGFLLSSVYVAVWLRCASLFRRARGGQPPRVAPRQAA